MRYKIKRKELEEFLSDNFLSHRELSKIAKTSPSYISRLKNEDCETVCGSKFAKRIIKAMGLPVKRINTFFYVKKQLNKVDIINEKLNG